MSQEVTVIQGQDRAQYVRERLTQLSTDASNMVIETGLLLREYQANGYWKEDGFTSFDSAIEALHNAGKVDYGPRQARNIIAVVTMVEKLSLDEAQKNLGISKLREIASLKSETDQRKLLESAEEMSVTEVQKEAKRLRDKAAGRETDPLEPIVIKGATASLHQFYKECVDVARVAYSLNENVPEAAVVEAILADWRSGVDVGADE